MRILLVRYKSLGDVVLTVPAVAAIRQAYPGATIEYVADDHLASVLEEHPAIDRLHRFPRSRFRRISVLRRAVEDADFTFTVARRGYDLVVDFAGSPRSAWLTFLTAAPRRIGYAHVRVRSVAYTMKVASGSGRPMHSACHHLALARAAGGSTDADPLPRIYLREDERRAARERLGGLGGGPFLAIHPGANGPRRRWPPGRFAALARWAGERFALPSLVLADPTAPGTAERIAADSGSTFLADRSLREFAALLGEAAVFCGNDSGPMHVAAALGVPVLAVFGPNAAEAWRPLVTPSRVVTPAAEGGAAGDVPIEAVKAAFEDLAGEAGLG